ncbi:MAG TPA: class I SAM-dependent methyltransferase [Bacteroidales bacterium]|nr:class I SAM-dependent methyltransferase [Bacteroidales bacterium]HOX73702.1 class I SAM-dependent methyltransferase [Bacteroidales bacterium]HPM86500.1 class I SAM-dependent methyltransferase [Bacteroidales bacterium]HQM68231.1 class I SAM-dependent methyltransferase [Bacteroidales bacterium]
MQYEPIKRSVGKLFSGPLFLRKILYCLLDLLLLRTWHVKKALRTIRKELPDNASILDAGSGFGQYSWRMIRMNRHWNITGVDIDKEHIDDCNTFFSRAGLSDRVTFRVADLTSFSEPDKFDLIISVDVMEHIRDDESVFRNFNSSLRKNGILLISTPSDKGGSDVHGDKEESFIGEHVRNGYSIDEITGKLISAGFRNTEAKYTYGRPGNISWHISMKYPVRLLNRSYLFALLLPFYYLIVFPVSLILNICDVAFTHKTGTGLIITARKQ